MENRFFSNIINKSELVTPDGVGIKIALAINGYSQERVPGVDFAKEMLKYCAKADIPVAMVGSTQKVVENSIKNLMMQKEK